MAEEPGAGCEEEEGARAARRGGDEMPLFSFQLSRVVLAALLLFFEK
jgi:hypothetical protein